MKAFNIEAPIYFGDIIELTSIFDENSKNILLLTSPSIFKVLQGKGVIAKIKESRNLEIFAEVLPNAPLVMLDMIAQEYQMPDLIVAIGGGSVIDTGKALSVTWTGGNVKDYFYGTNKLGDSKIPIITVPTTAGTGAELSYGAILEDTEKGKKGGLRGEIVQSTAVFIDIELYKSAPGVLMAETGFDCLTHAIETYISNSSSPLVEFQSVRVIHTVFEHLITAVREKSDVAVEAMAISSALMGINLAKSSTCLPHRIQYVIGPYTDTSHAQGLIMLYRGWLPIISKEEKFSSLSSQLGLTKEEFIDKINWLKSELDINYTLTDYGVEEKVVEELANRVEGNMKNDPCYKDVNTIINILKGSL